MSQLALHQVAGIETADSGWKRVCWIGGVTALLQLACLLVSAIVGITLGAEPTTAEEYFTVLQNDGVAGLLRLDFATLILIFLFAGTSFGVYAALRKKYQAFAALATTLVFAGVILALASHSTLSIIYLSERYAAATTAVQQSQLLAAGEAVVASHMWNSTAGFLAGVFMQGGFVFISIIMLREKGFAKATAYTGILANGFDFIHLFVGLFMPSLGIALLYIGGPFYLLWFPLLGRDLMRLARQPA